MLDGIAVRAHYLMLEHLETTYRVYRVYRV
jgi:hypothetical protein